MRAKEAPCLSTAALRGDVLKCPLIIGGRETLGDTFGGLSLFYPGYSYPVANAGALDIAQAIGSARNAKRTSLKTRVACLQKAAAAFSYRDEDCEHAVRMTGMPVSIIKEHFDSIPGILGSLSQSLGSRFTHFGGSESLGAEMLDAGFYKLLTPQGGFCYAITPGNDVRVVAMVAANLCYAGMPFIIKASKEDAAAPLVIRALLDGGFPPGSCNLLYFDSAAQDAAKKHFRIMDASRTVWTFGSDETVDVALRYESAGSRTYLDITDLMTEGGGDIEFVRQGFAENSFRLRDRLVTKDEVVDHFIGKNVLRHGCGNCAIIASGQFDEQVSEILYRSLGYAIGCNAAKSAMIVDSPHWIEQAADYLASLPVGDPLDPKTRVGYVNPATLDYLLGVVDGKRGIEVFGGERLSSIQARPLVARSREIVPELFGQEIPAYVLAAMDCATTGEAVVAINGCSGKNPRLSVSMLNVGDEHSRHSISELKAHAVFINAPTTVVAPYFHEGNDYVLRLSRERLVNGNRLMEWDYL